VARRAHSCGHLVSSKSKTCVPPDPDRTLALRSTTPTPNPWFEKTNFPMNCTLSADPGLVGWNGFCSTCSLRRSAHSSSAN